MDILTAMLAISSVVGALFLKLLLSEIEAWLPRLACFLIARAVVRLPELERERHREEWLADSNQFPGKLAKLWHALGCLVATLEMRELKRDILPIVFTSEEERRQWLLLFEAFLEYRKENPSTNIEKLNYSNELTARIEHHAAGYECSPAIFAEALKDLIFVHDNKIPISGLIQRSATPASPPQDPRSRFRPT